MPKLQYHPKVTIQYHPKIAIQYHPKVTIQYHPKVAIQYHPKVTIQYHPKVAIQFGQGYRKNAEYQRMPIILIMVTKFMNIWTIIMAKMSRT